MEQKDSEEIYQTLRSLALKGLGSFGASSLIGIIGSIIDERSQCHVLVIR
jgi:hypothetical protein